MGSLPYLLAIFKEISWLWCRTQGLLSAHMHTPYEYMVGFFWSLGKNIVLPRMFDYSWLTQTSIILEIEG